MTALDPEERNRTRADTEERLQLPTLSRDDSPTTEPSVAHTLNENLDERSLTNREEHAGGQREADPVWTWNAPDFLTGDPDATQREAGAPNATQKLTLKEKAENLRLYFGSLEDYERRKGGRTHYRIILSFDVPATNQQIRELANTFLERTFPKAIAFGAIHRDTDHPHAHLYLNSRQTDGRRIQLKNTEFKTIDEKWARIYTEFAGDKSAYVDYLRKKEETRQWKIAAAEAYQKGEPIPPKPERDDDIRERLAEQRLSAQRSEASDHGKQLDPRPPAGALSRPASEKETSRLLAKKDVAREQLAHLIRTDAPNTDIKSAARIAYEFTRALDKTLALRKEKGRDKPPQTVYTTEEWKQLKEYHTSHELAVKDDRAAARLQAARVIAGAELKDAQEKAEAFNASRHFWKFDVEGWARGTSLKEIEQAIKTKTEEKFRLYNFLRPGKRREIGGQIDYLQDVKKDIQKQLTAKELNVQRNLGAGELRYQIASKQVEQTARARAEQGKQMPAPAYEGDELIRIDAIANRHRDAGLLRYVYANIRDRVLDNPSRQALSRIKGRAMLARLDMLKEGERFNASLKFGDFRQVPLKDAQGLNYVRSLREISPKNALETIIRHFTDSVDQKKESKDVANSVRRQQERAEQQASKASDFSFVMDKILDEHCRAAGVSASQVFPLLNAAEIAELREFAEKMPYVSRIRKEFSDAARQGERSLEQREMAAARESHQSNAHDISIRPNDPAPLRTAEPIERIDPNSSSRGR